VEIQTTAEHEAFSRAEFDQLLNLAERGIRELTALQRRVLEL
jgi:ribonuclease PH